jgi:quinol-cytochrome oxidoreductase complex cytochrome b subunit
MRQVWEDLKASTDASLLGLARFFGLLYGPIDRHLRIDQALRKAWSYRLPGHVNWRHALGGITYLLFLVLIVTGVLLAFYYRPSAQEAYQSIQHIVSQVPFGWLMRDLHVWTANLIVIAALAHMARVFFSGAYKPPRETNWLVGLLLLGTVLVFGASGYLLPWDQWAYWTVTEVLNVLDRVPVVRSLVAVVVKGDVIVSGATLSRSFAIHVIILPWIALVLLGFHFTMLRKHGIAPPKYPPKVEKQGVPFFPHHLLRTFVISVLVLSVAVSLAVLYPRPVGDPASAFQAPSELVSSWVPVSVSLALIRYLGTWGFVGFSLLGLAMALLPLVDRSPERRLRKRPVVALLGYTFFLGYLVLWVVGRQVRSLPPSAPVEPPRLEERAPPVPLPEIGPSPVRPAPPDSGTRARRTP